MLEARKLCSGATGRNGGHIKTEPHGEFAMLKKRFGAERAAKIIRFKTRHVDVLTELAETQGIDTAEGRKVETVDLHFDKEIFEKRKMCVADLEKHIPEMVKDYKIWEAVEATKVSLVFPINPFYPLLIMHNSNSPHRPTSQAQYPTPPAPYSPTDSSPPSSRPSSRSIPLSSQSKLTPQ